MLREPPWFIKYTGTILKVSIHTLQEHPVIFFPFILTAFIEVFILELLYFIPQYPADLFFAPVIRALWGEAYLHYPSNFYLLPQLFQDIQIPLSIFVGSFLAALAVSAVAQVNNGEAVDLKQSVKTLVKQYVHIMLAALLAFLLVFIFLKAHSLIVNRGLQIRSMSGGFYLIKRIVVDSRMAVSFILNVLAASLMLYTLPVIVAEKKKIHTAVWSNLKLVFRNFGTTFTVVLLCSLIYIPVFMVKAVIIKGLLAPEWTLLMIIMDVLVMMVINALMYTAATTIYLSKQEECA